MRSPAFLDMETEMSEEKELTMPKHVAIILDGNGRWAKAKGMPRNYGHAQGAKTVEVICEEAYNIIMESKQVNVADMIERPPHYNREGAMESIDEMELIFGKEAVKHFCLCNIWKYRYRASDKNGKEDLEKSDWYMRKYRELCSNE